MTPVEFHVLQVKRERLIAQKYDHRRGVSLEECAELDRLAVAADGYVAGMVERILARLEGEA